MTATAQAIQDPMMIELATARNNEAFYFPQGMAGFGEAHEYGFIYEGHGDIICIQSLDQPEAAFLITPWDEARLGPTPTPTPDERACLQAETDEQIMWMLVLNPFADKQWVTANLKAPVALNPDARIGLQCIRPDPDLDIRYRWMRQPN